MAKDLKLSNFLTQCGLVAPAEIREGLFVLSDRLRDRTASSEDLRAAMAFLEASIDAANGKGEPRMKPFADVYKRIHGEWVKNHPKS